MEKLVDSITDMTWLEGRALICCASLSHHGLLGSIEKMRLKDVNLAAVPAEHLASLFSCVTSFILIKNVSGCDLVNLMDSVQCQSLRFYKQRLGRQETRALVRAMETRVEFVWLYDDTMIDISALIKYSGRGECWELTCWNPKNEISYRNELRQWALERNPPWRVSRDKSGDLSVQSFRKLKAIEIKEEIKQLSGENRSIQNAILKNMGVI